MDSYLQLSPESSAPHTPSPRNSFDIDDMNNSNQQFQDAVKADNSVSFQDQHLDPSRNPDQSAFWNQQNDSMAVPPRGYLSELYDERMKLEQSQQETDFQRASPHPYQPSPSPHMWQEGEQDHYFRRASYPQARHDDPMHPAQPFLHSEPGSFLGPYTTRSDAFYGEPMSMPEHMPLAADPSALHGHPMDDPYLSSASASPHSSIHEFEGIDSAHSSPVIVPTQAPFFRPGSSGGLHHHHHPHHPAAFMNPHASLPVMHTDDAASKETQYLRRRCFNCHTTEPPSWRRSTLNPGKIVCNKCGLYERTHLRPRPHRFDELRAGSKARKAAAAAKAAPSPSTSPKNKLEGIKKEPNEGSVTSVGSSGISEWESGSVYSASSSAPNSGYNSPMTSTFPMPNPSLPQSRPSSREGPIRLPSAPLTDIATRMTKVPPPAKASTAPYYVEGRSTTLGRPMAQPTTDFYARRASLPTEAPMDPTARLAPSLGMPEVTGWQVVPPTDLNNAKQEQDRKAPRKVAAA